MVCGRKFVNERRIMYELRVLNLYFKICKIWNEEKFEKWLECVYIEIESINFIELG